ncbi:MAG: hypothetical protein KatS3mg101_1063 [Patescibacteria group bacterium]|nr:MAG: hypothetical protein KatS3mg101_1063 [Patescibacteria group bacterium]
MLVFDILRSILYLAVGTNAFIAAYMFYRADYKRSRFARSFVHLLVTLGLYSFMALGITFFREIALNVAVFFANFLFIPQFLLFVALWRFIQEVTKN